MALPRQAVAATATAALLIGGAAAVFAGPAASQETLAVPQAVTVAVSADPTQAPARIQPRVAPRTVASFTAKPLPTPTPTAEAAAPTRKAEAPRTTKPAASTRRAAATNSTLRKAKASTTRTKADATPRKAKERRTAAAPVRRAAGGSLNLARAAMWDRIATCESGGNWSINTGNGYYGGLQFARATWRGAGGGDFASLPHLASRAEQITVANRLYAQSGLRPWGCRHAA